MRALWGASLVTHRGEANDSRQDPLEARVLSSKWATATCHHDHQKAAEGDLCALQVRVGGGAVSAYIVMAAGQAAVSSDRARAHRGEG